MIRGVSVVWTYRLSFFTRYEKSHGLLGPADLADLRKSRAGFALDQRDISAVEKPIHIEIFSEVRARYRVARLRFGLSDIGRIDKPIRVSVAQQHVHAHRRDIPTVTGRIAYPMKGDADMRGIGNTSEIDNVLVRVSSNAATDLVLRQGLRSAAGVGRSGDATGTRTNERIEEGEDQGVISERTTAQTGLNCSRSARVEIHG